LGRVVFFRDEQVVDQTGAPPGPESLLATAALDAMPRSGLDEQAGALRCDGRRRAASGRCIFLVLIHLACLFAGYLTMTKWLS
jgi:hypothetical protein